MFGDLERKILKIDFLLFLALKDSRRSILSDKTFQNLWSRSLFVALQNIRQLELRNVKKLIFPCYCSPIRKKVADYNLLKSIKLLE